MDEENEDQNVRVLNLLAQLREGSEYLENQKEALGRLWDGLRGKVVTFYETNPTISDKRVCSRYHTIRIVFLPYLESPVVASSACEDSRLTPTVCARIIRKGRKASPNGATIVCSAFFT